MHVLAIVVTAAAIHVAIVRLRLALGVLIAGAVAVLAAVGLLVPPSSVLESGAGGVAVLLALLTATTRRQARVAADGLAGATWDAVPVSEEGARLVAVLEEHGFVAGRDGWARAEGSGWSLLALQRGPVRVLVVSGERGPTMDASTVFDNGQVLLTAPSARLPVPPHVVRQCIPSTDALEVVAEHERTVVDAVDAGRLPVAASTGDLTGAALAAEVAAARYALSRGPLAATVTIWRELTGREADLGPVTERPDAWAPLVADTV